MLSADEFRQRLLMLVQNTQLPVGCAPYSSPEFRLHASREGLGPLLASVLRSQASGDVRKWCDRQLTLSWDRHLRNLTDLEFTLETLSGSGVEAIPLKGAFFALRHYDPPFLRKPPTDIDIAVRGRDLERAAHALQTAGFALDYALADARRSSHHLTFSHPSRTRVEAHFKFANGPHSIPVDAAFERATPATLPSGLSVLCLHPADELLQLTLHLASHRFASFFHLCELRRLWRPALPAAKYEVIDRAIEGRFAAALRLTDLGFRKYWNEPFLPPDVTLPKTWLHWRLNAQSYDAYESWLTPGRRLGARLNGRLLDLQMTDNPGDALRWLGTMLHVSWVRLKRREWGATLK